MRNDFNVNYDVLYAPDVGIVSTSGGAVDTSIKK